jgi:hypothetical protein
MNNVIEFINRRFKSDCKWKNGNCYYFALILKDRFNGEIYYDVIDGHFVCKIEDKYYDWEGIYETTNVVVNWNNFDIYDRLQKQSIIKYVLN